MTTDNTFDKEILNILTFTAEHETMAPNTMTTKLFEEGGELAEAVLYELGILPYKTKEFDPVIEEAADVINVTVGLLTTLYRHEKSPEEIHAELLAALAKKSAKYERVITTRGPINEDFRLR